MVSVSILQKNLASAVLVYTYVHEKSCVLYYNVLYTQKKKIMFQNNVRIMERNNKVCFSYHYIHVEYCSMKTLKWVNIAY